MVEDNEEKNRNVGDRLDGEGVTEKDKNKIRTLMSNLIDKISSNATGVISAMTVGLMIVVIDFIPIEFIALLINSFWESLLNYREFLPISIAGISGFLAYFGLRQMTARSNYEKDNQELLSSINSMKANLVLQIAIEENDGKREEIRNQILNLDNQYKILSGKILQNKDGGYVEDWRSVLLSGHKRLLDEEDRLMTLNKKNLGAGILLIAVGIIFLMYATGFFEQSLEGNIRQASNSNTGKNSGGINIWNFLANYGPIFSILFLIEIPTFFFLSLYASNERKIERNKSDLTNIELRLTAGLMLYDEKNIRNFPVLAEALAQEDSKFVLGKNESSGGGGTNKLLETLLKLTPTGGG